jgi:hypothetical protein
MRHYPSHNNKNAARVRHPILYTIVENAIAPAEAGMAG